ncbi:MAG TPA: MDR family MFS transporter [Nocardioides sp.]|nr:MDR family MFS transporter [Nocardioides sp.]
MTAPTEADDLAPKAFEVYDAELEAELASGKTPLVIKLLVAATFVVILNETITVNAIPKLADHFDITLASAGWVTTVFMLTMAALIPLTGWFLQRVSTRTAYASAMIAFTTGTVVAAAAPTFGFLLAGRVIQASGTAVMMPLLMTTLMTVVLPQDRGRVMGQVTLAMSVAPAMGPAVSGLVLQTGNWRMIFVVVLPIAAVVGFSGYRLLENIGEPKKSSVSWISVVLAALGFGSLVYGLNKVGHAKWTEPTGIIAVGVVLVTLFVLNQLRLQRSGTPLLDLRTLKHPTYAKSLILMAAAFLGFFGSMILLPGYLQNLRGLSALQSGLVVMPGGLAMGLLGPRVGKVFDRLGSRPLVIPGAVGMVAMLLLLSQIGTGTSFWLIIPIHVVLMSCLAAIFTPVFSLGLGDLPQQLYSHGSSLLGTLQQVSGAIGAALLLVIQSNRATSLAQSGHSPADSFVGGFEAALLTSAALGLVVVVMSLLLPARPTQVEGAPQGH